MYPEREPPERSVAMYVSKLGSSADSVVAELSVAGDGACARAAPNDTMTRPAARRPPARTTIRWGQTSTIGRQIVARRLLQRGFIRLPLSFRLIFQTRCYVMTGTARMLGHFAFVAKI